METVLSTPELLEGILLAADAATILTKCQPVCRAWYRAIQTSPSLQRHLFFLSEPPAKASIPPRKNQLLVRKFGFMFGDTTENSVVSRKSFEQLALTKAREAFARPDATWRRMHISQPATRTLAVLDLSSSRARQLVCTAEQVPRPSAAYNADNDPETAGWRMSEFYRYVFQYMVHNRVSYLCIWWGSLPAKGVGFPGLEQSIPDDQKAEAREKLEKLFYENNQVVLVRKSTVQCVKGFKEGDLSFRDNFNMD